MPGPEHDPTRDEALAREIAEFIAERAFDFTHHECRAWALSDFKVWTQIAGFEPAMCLAGPHSTCETEGSRD